MDFIENRTRDIMQMSLDGLYERSKAIAANTAKRLIDESSNASKMQNAIMYQKNPDKILQGQSPEQIAFLNSDINKDFLINVEEDLSQGYDIDGNNVNIETEMMDEAQNGMKYNVIANLLSKSYQQLSNVIKGQNS